MKPSPVAANPSSAAHAAVSSSSRRPMFGRWCEVTGWHGIVDAYLAESIWSKLTWVLVIIVSLALTINQCLSLILDFASDDQWMTSVTLESPSEIGMEWPNMTVSNHETYLKSLLGRMQIDSNPFRVANLKLPSMDSLEFVDRYISDEPTGNISYFEQLLREQEEGARTSAENLFEVALMSAVDEQCNKTAIHCGSTSDFDLSKEMNACCDQPTAFLNKFSVHISAAVGRSMDTGRDNSIYFLFDPRVNDYYEYVFKREIPTAGLALQLYYGQPEVAETTEIELSPGTHTLIGVTRGRFRTIQRVSKTMNFERPRKKPCRENTDYAHFDYDKYSRSLCRTDCFVRATVNMCGCAIWVSTTFAKPASTNACMGSKLVTCGEAWDVLQKDMRNNANTSDARSILDCLDRCEEGCDYETIDIRVSTSKFPAPVKVPKFTRYLNRALGYRGLNFTDEDTRQLMLLEMFYESRQIRVVERSTRTTLDELVSNIGGAMGVWTGLSILSLYQMVVYFLSGLFCWR